MRGGSTGRTVRYFQASDASVHFQVRPHLSSLSCNSSKQRIKSRMKQRISRRAYYENPRLMAEFLWRFDHLSPVKCGHDESIQAANLSPKVDGRVREKLGIKDNNIPLYKYEMSGLKGMGQAYGPRPPTKNRSLVSRCARSLPAVWIPTC